MNLATLERQATLQSDLAAIPQMAPADLAALVARYEAAAKSAADEVSQALEQISTRTVSDYFALRSLKTLARERSAAQKSLERIQRAIAKAEKTGRPGIPGLTLQPPV